MKRSMRLGAALVIALCQSSWPADWPVLRGNSRHTGYLPDAPGGSFHLVWVRQFQEERLGTAMEPIVSKDKVFVATHRGNVYGLDGKDGRPLWRFAANGAFLQAPAIAEDLMVAASTDGNLYGIDARNGQPRWSFYIGQGGCSAAPIIEDGTVFIGGRGGDVVAVTLASGEPRWRHIWPVPIRQTAAYAKGRVFVMAEDMRVRCLDAGTGRELWTSQQLTGQTARDYYPVVVQTGDRSFVVVRTNPLLGMGNQIGRDRHLLCQTAGVDDRGWEKVDAWIKSPAARGTPELWETEQRAIIKYLEEHREARTFFALDTQTGREALTAPVLWIGGCQSVGAMPAAGADGRLLVFYRSAYGNWNHGVAPLVALGWLDLARNRIHPLEHRHGAQPPWNTFWGTADESQNFVLAGQTVLLVHQGTLSRFDLETGRLSKIWGERDTYGGFPSPAWARNEWHGPGRGGVAMADGRIYWLTGSRILCLAPGEPGNPPDPVSIDGSTLPAHAAGPPVAWSQAQIQERLEVGIGELLSRRWAPLYVEPGLSGRDFSFDHSGEMFETLAWCYPHLSSIRQDEVKSWLAEEWAAHPPFAKEAWYSLKEGSRREYFWSPEEGHARSGQDKPPDPFGNLFAVWLYAQRCGEWDRVLRAWPQIKEGFESFSRRGWELDPAKGDLYANRYLASLQALGRIAERAGDTNLAERSQRLTQQTEVALAAWWERAARQGTLTSFNGTRQLDPFIGRGDAISFRVAPHRHKVALLRDLTPEVAALIRRQAPEAVDKIWATFQTLYATWPLTGEERQVHFGENFVDPPDLALSGFKALTWLQGAPSDELVRRIDLPFCRADLYFFTKLALCLEP